MILAAGLGTRLRPLTNDRPKALVQIEEMTLLEIAIRRLKYFGIQEIIVNIHHFGQQIIDFLTANNHFGIQIYISDERAQLLETGGAIKAAQPFIGNAPCLIYNTDILSTIDLRAFIAYHQNNKQLATLAVRNRTTSRKLLFNQTNQLVGWINKKTGEQKISRSYSVANEFGFSGIHIIEPTINQYFPPESKFSIIDVYLKVAQSETIIAYPHDEDQWLDVGKPEQLLLAPNLLRQLKLSME